MSGRKSLVLLPGPCFGAGWEAPRGNVGSTLADMKSATAAISWAPPQQVLLREDLAALPPWLPKPLWLNLCRWNARRMWSMSAEYLLVRPPLLGGRQCPGQLAGTCCYSLGTSQKGAAEAGGSPLVWSINQGRVAGWMCQERNTLSPSWIRHFLSMDCSGEQPLFVKVNSGTICIHICIIACMHICIYIYRCMCVFVCASIVVQSLTCVWLFVTP